jgi:hypothetical protein
VNEIIADGQTRISWVTTAGPPVDLSGHVTSMRFECVTEENFLDGWAKPIRITLRGRSDRLSPLAYRLLLGRPHPRIRCMHSAYGRRRGRGCW